MYGQDLVYLQQKFQQEWRNKPLITISGNAKLYNLFGRQNVNISY